MKILQILPALDTGGAQSLVTHLASDHNQNTSTVSLFLLAGVRDERGRFLLSQLEKSGVAVHGKANRRVLSFWNLCKLINIFYSFKPDIVHAHLYSSEVLANVARLLASEFCRKSSFIRTIHTSDLGLERGPLVLKILSILFHITVLCNSTFRKSYVTFYGTSKNIKTIENGINFPDIETNSKTGGLNRKFIIGHVGSFDHGPILSEDIKGRGFLIEAFAQAFKTNRDIELRFAGDGRMRAEAERLAGKLGVSDQISFLGSIESPWVFLSELNLFCFPSHLEGLSLSLIEAASMGIPIVASNIKENKLLDIDGIWSYCQAGDPNSIAQAMVSAVSNYEKLIKPASTMAKKIRAHYSLPQCSGRYLQLYRKLSLSKVGETL